ncbi:MAG TPA: hypothetical protein VFX30_01690 [bacterium]|nr:hypothetical protein [bacterium]
MKKSILAVLAVVLLAPAVAGARGEFTIDPIGPGVRPVRPACGNGLLEAGESCDDSNQDDADGCLSDCSLPLPPPATVPQPPETQPAPVPENPPAPEAPAETPPEAPSADVPAPPIDSPENPTGVSGGIADAGSLSCQALTASDVGAGGRVIAVRSDGLVPLVVRYETADDTAGVSAELKQVAGLAVALGSGDHDFGAPVIEAKSLAVSDASQGGAEWIVYVQRPADLRGEWHPDAAFEVEVRAADGATIATLSTGCLAAADAKGGGCSLARGAGRKTYSDGCALMTAITAAFLIKRRSRLSPY